MSLYISNALDRVWQKGLLAKLRMFGLHHTLIEWIGSLTQLSYPHNYPSPRSLPSCLTIQFYSFNQLLFPVLLSINSSSVHLLASFTTNPSAPKSMNLVIHLFNICLYKHVSHFNKLVSPSFKHNSINGRLSDSVFSAR